MTRRFGISFETISRRPQLRKDTAADATHATQRNNVVQLPVTPSTQRHQLGGVSPSFYSNARSLDEYGSEHVAPAISAGFFIAFAISVGLIFGAIVFFASLILEPGGLDTKLVEYQKHVESRR